MPLTLTCRRRSPAFILMQNPLSSTACRLRSCHPLQISKLSRLQALGLHYTDRYAGESCALLAALPALRCLSLGISSPVPACLSQLTRLESLPCWNNPGIKMRRQQTCSQQGCRTSRLTHLALSTGAGQVAAALQACHGCRPSFGRTNRACCRPVPTCASFNASTPLSTPCWPACRRWRARTRLKPSVWSAA